jgi:RND family efflux transporter MFP subunit
MPGTVEGYETVDLYAKIGGYLEEIVVDIGDPICEGQELARLYVPEMGKEIEQREAEVNRAESRVEQALAAIRQAEAEVARAEAELEVARIARREKQARLQFRNTEYRRLKELVESRALESRLLDEGQYQLDAAEAALDSADARARTAQAVQNAAKANLDKAKTDADVARREVDVARAQQAHAVTMLQYATVCAPFDGLVTQRRVDPGAFIQPADRNSAAEPLLTVTRIDVVRVLLDLPMAEVRFLNRGDPAMLDRINVLPSEKFAGEVKRFSPSLNTRSRMMRVEIELPNLGERLLPGCYGYVTLTLKQLPTTPVIPSSALLTDGDDEFVYVVEDGICRRRMITTNYHDGSIVGIATGLAPGDLVVRAGGGQLTDGQEVVARLGRTG